MKNRVMVFLATQIALILCGCNHESMIITGDISTYDYVEDNKIDFILNYNKYSQVITRRYHPVEDNGFFLIKIPRETTQINSLIVEYPGIDSLSFSLANVSFSEKNQVDIGAIYLYNKIRSSINDGVGFSSFISFKSDIEDISYYRISIVYMDAELSHFICLSQSEEIPPDSNEVLLSDVIDIDFELTSEISENCFYIVEGIKKYDETAYVVSNSGYQVLQF